MESCLRCTSGPLGSGHLVCPSNLGSGFHNHRQLFQCWRIQHSSRVSFCCMNFWGLSGSLAFLFFWILWTKKWLQLYCTDGAMKVHFWNKTYRSQRQQENTELCVLQWENGKHAKRRPVFFLILATVIFFGYFNVCGLYSRTKHSALEVYPSGAYSLSCRNRPRWPNPAKSVCFGISKPVVILWSLIDFSSVGSARVLMTHTGDKWMLWMLPDPVEEPPPTQVCSRIQRFGRDQIRDKCAFPRLV